MSKIANNLPKEVDTPFISVQTVAVMTSLSVREVWRRRGSDEQFPKPCKLSARKTMWVKGEVEAWRDEIIRRRG